MEDTSSAPRGIYTSSNTNIEEYNIPPYATIYKYSDQYYRGSFYIRRSENESTTGMFVFDGFTNKFRKLAFNDDLNLKCSFELIFHYETTNGGVLLTDGESFTISNEIESIIASGRYLARATLSSSSTYSSANATGVICTFNSHYDAIIDRDNLKSVMFRLNRDADTITFKTYGENQASCRLVQVYIYRL